MATAVLQAPNLFIIFLQVFSFFSQLTVTYVTIRFFRFPTAPINGDGRKVQLYAGMFVDRFIRR